MTEHGKKVFLTGANGFVASQILSDLVKVPNLHHPVTLAAIDTDSFGVQAGYLVTASVRSEAKAREVLELHPEWKANTTFVYVADIAAQGALDKVFETEVEGFDYIIHTASPVNFKATDIQKDVIEPAVKG